MRPVRTEYVHSPTKPALRTRASPRSQPKCGQYAIPGHWHWIDGSRPIVRLRLTVVSPLLRSTARRRGHYKRSRSAHSTSTVAIWRDGYVQRAVDVKVDVTAFVSKIASSAVLT